MKRLVNIWGYIILVVTIIFHLWLNFPETKILADPNDNIFQYELVARSDWIWEKYECPFSLQCLPNLTDHNVPAWAEGYPLPFYYSHIPQLTMVSTYHMLVKPIVSIFYPAFSLYEYYNWFKYLALCLFPLPIFLALRVVGFSPFASAVGAFFGSNFSTDGLYGIDPPSFLWRGYGLVSQLFAQFFLPLGIAFTYKALKNGQKKPEEQKNGNKYKNNWIGSWNFQKRDIFFASIFLTLATTGHLGVGIIGLLSTVPFLFLNLRKSELIERAKKLTLIYFGLFLALAYWIIPVLIWTKYHIISFWDPIWKFNSYGWYEVLRQFFQGELFDWKRPSVITFLVIGGFFVLMVSEKFPFAILLVYWLALYFGRTTWGGLIDLIPGMKDFHLHRFLVGVQIAGLFLIPAFIEWLDESLHKMFVGGIKIAKIIRSLPRLFASLTSDKSKKTALDGNSLNTSISSSTQTGVSILVYAVIFLFLGILTYFTLKQTLDYAYYNNKWIKEANDAYNYDYKNYQDLVRYLASKPPGRIYAGRPGNWGRDFKLGSTELYMLLSIYGFDISQFLPETWSPLSENDQNFDERVNTDYDLLNIKYVVAPKNEGFGDKVVFDKKFGPFEVYTVPTTGWFDVVTAPELVKTDKTNYINLVHVWHRSYARTWNMHPLISVEKNPDVPVGTQKVIQMTDEVTYKDNGVEKNIFTDFPLVFPQSTVSGQIKSESVNVQTYSGVVEVPQNCSTACFIMFKMSYHPDWEAKLDGKVVPKYAVFPFYLAVQATPGTHTIEFTYYPNKLKVLLLWGEILSVLGFIGWKVRKRIKIVNK